MNKRRIVVCVSIIMILTLSVLVASNYPSKSIVKELEQPAKFVLASWDFPDEYGQGIPYFEFFENSTGSWVSLEYYYEYFNSYIVEWNASVFIKLRCTTIFNNTLIGAIDTDDGKLYQQHSVIVTTPSESEPVFSQQNFTYYSANTVLEPMWYYEYEVVLNFLPVGGEIYTVTVTYEIYW